MTAAVEVVHLTSTLDRGGAETVLLELLAELPADEVRQTFVVLGRREGLLAGEFRAAGGEVLLCPLRPVATLPGRLFRLLRRRRPRTVVAHINLASGLLLATARVARVPYRIARLWSAGDDQSASLRQRVRRAALRALLAWGATDVLGVTEAATRWARPYGAGDSRYRVLVNTTAARPAASDRTSARTGWQVPEDALVLAHAGRSIPCKNRPFLLEVHDAVRRRRPDARLLLAGPDGVDDLVAARPSCRTDPRVVLAGEVADVAEVWAAADVLVLPSTREGLPGVVLEALAAGVPCVASDLPCLREVVPLVDGLVLVPLDAPAELWAAAVIDSAGADPDARERIAARLRSSPFLHPYALRAWRELWHR